MSSPPLPSERRAKFLAAQETIAFRPACARDDAFIDALAKASGLGVSSAKERVRSHAQLWVALTPPLKGVQQGELLLGFVLAWLVADESEVLDIAVSETMQNRGVGALLLNKILVESRKNGCNAAYLEVRRSNWKAQRLYLKAGFSPVGQRRHYYKNGEDALLFHCCLEGAD